MDDQLYTKPVINRFLNKNLFFNDLILKKHFQNNDVAKFRKRLVKNHSKESFEKLIYVIITDLCRDVILNVVGEITEFMKDIGDLVLSGGEAFNYHMEPKDRLVTSDIDAKFVPMIKYDKKYFGKLQAIKLKMWNKMGQIAKKIDPKIKKRLAKNNKIMKFIGFNVLNNQQKVLRRYTLIKKTKTRKDELPSSKDVFIDVELFALDLKVRCISPETGTIKQFKIGGILDVPFMRPGEFGYEVTKSKHRGYEYLNYNTKKTIKNDKILVASKKFLMEDIYLMHTLKLRPEKKEKDRQRLIKLGKTFISSVTLKDTIESVVKKVKSEFKNTPTPRVFKNINVKNYLKINPKKYSNLNAPEKSQKIAKQFIYKKNKNMAPTYGNHKFNLNSQTWKKESNLAYIGNQYKLRPIGNMNVPNTLPKMEETLYGFKKERNYWVPKPLLEKATQIQFSGLKNTINYNI
jgi:hypothetical protein